MLTQMMKRTDWKSYGHMKIGSGFTVTKFATVVVVKSNGVTLASATPVLIVQTMVPVGAVENWYLTRFWKRV